MRSSVSDGYNSMICSRRGNLRRASSEFIFSAFNMFSTTCIGSTRRSGNWVSVTVNNSNQHLREEIILSEVFSTQLKCLDQVIDHIKYSGCSLLVFFCINLNKYLPGKCHYSPASLCSSSLNRLSQKLAKVMYVSMTLLVSTKS